MLRFHPHNKKAPSIKFPLVFVKPYATVRSRMPSPDAVAGRRRRRASPLLPLSRLTPIAALQGKDIQAMAKSVMLKEKVAVEPFTLLVVLDHPRCAVRSPLVPIVSPTQLTTR